LPFLPCARASFKVEACREGSQPGAHTKMARNPYRLLLDVSVVAIEPSRWEWQVREGDKLIMSGYQTSRETAQIDGDSALFYLLRCQS
jgi:hypothetical protein